MTDKDSAKMATSKGVYQGYAAQAPVDSRPSFGEDWISLDTTSAVYDRLKYAH